MTPRRALIGLHIGALAWRYVPYLLAARLDGREH